MSMTSRYVQRDTIDAEVAQLPNSAGSLSAALSELTSFITDEGLLRSATGISAK
jgi:hypothetical protein